MSTLSQVGRGAVLLTSMALVACYIDVYTTGKFPWQHAAAVETPTTSPLPEFINDPAVQTAQYVVEQGATQATPVFLPGSKSDVAGGAVIVQTPAEYGQSTPATPLFLSGTKSFTGQTTVMPGTLTGTPPASNEAANSSKIDIGASKQLFMSASKSSPAGPAIGVYPILIFSPQPESSGPAQMPGTSSGQTSVPPFSPPFVGDTNRPGTALATGTTPPTIPQTAPPGISSASYPQSPATNASSFRPNVSPQQNAPPANDAPLNYVKQPTIFMSGGKSPIRHADIPSITDPVPAISANLPNLPPVPTHTTQFMGGSKTISLPPRLPEAMAPATTTDKMQFMGGSKSPGPLVMPSAVPQSPGPRVQIPTQFPMQGKPTANMPSLPVTQQQQTAPLKVTPKVPGSPAGSY